MIEITQEKREQIRWLAGSEGFKDNEITVFDEIPEQKLEKFKVTLAKKKKLEPFGHDEELIMFKPFALESGSDAILITNKTLYFKYFQYANLIQLEDIVLVKVDPFDTTQISFVLKNGTTEEVYVAELYNEIEELIRILLAGTGIEQAYNEDGKLVVEVAEKTAKNNLILAYVMGVFEWLEFFLVVLVISYYTGFDLSGIWAPLGRIPLTGIQIYLLSIAVSTCFLIISILIRKFGTFYKKKWRFVFAVGSSVFWIILDLVLLASMLGWININFF